MFLNFRLLKIWKPATWCLKCLFFADRIPPMKFYCSWLCVYLQWVMIHHGWWTTVYFIGDKKNQGKFLSPNIQFSPIMQRIWEMRNKARKKTRKAFFKYWLYCVSRTASCALSEIISKMKREDNPLLKSEVPEAPSTPLEIHFMQQNLWNKLVLCILS